MWPCPRLMQQSGSRRGVYEGNKSKIVFLKTELYGKWGMWVLRDAWRERISSGASPEPARC